MKYGNTYLGKYIVPAALIYFIICGLILFRFGIQLGGEAEKYIDCANRILQGKELRNGFFGILYVFYSAIVALLIKFSVPLVAMAVLQTGLSFLAALFLYRLVLEVLDSKPIAFLFFCAYLLCYPIQKWNFFLYTEGLHTSLLVISAYLFHKTMSEGKSRQWIFFGLMLLAVIFSRPVGMIFFFAALSVIIKKLYKQKNKVSAFLLAFAGIALVVGILNTPVSNFINPDSLKRMEIICQVPEANANIDYQEINRAGLYKAFKVIKEDVGFGNFFTIACKKLECFFGMIRPYYSWQNNCLLVLYWIFYPLALIGIFSKPKGPFVNIRSLSATYLLLSSFAIVFTCDDWANRFIAPAFPFILILAAAGFQQLSGWWKLPRKKV